MNEIIRLPRRPIDTPDDHEDAAPDWLHERDPLADDDQGQLGRSALIYLAGMLSGALFATAVMVLI